MAFPTTGVLDTFNRANGNVGANWTAPVWTDIDPLTIVSNTVRFSTVGNDAGGYWNPNSFGPDCEVFLTMTSVDDVYMILRGTTPGDPTLDGYAGRFQPGSTFVYRIDNAVKTQLGATITTTISNADAAGAAAVGSDITVYTNHGGTWASVGTRSDATYSASGRIGLFSGSVATQGDDFGGGTVAPDTGLAWIKA